MPVQKCTLDGKPGYKWGKEGKCFTYNPDTEGSEARARNRASKQGAAIKANREQLNVAATLSKIPKEGTTDGTLKRLQAIRSLVSLLPGGALSRTNTDTLQIEDYGLSFYGIPQFPEITDASQYKRLYKFHGVATRVVDIYPDKCWQDFPRVREGSDPRETEFEKAWKELTADPKLQVPGNLLKSDQLSGIGRFGILFLGLGDSEQPEKEAKATDELLYLRAFDESVVTIDSTENNTSSPRFGQPTMYKIQFGGKGSTGKDSKPIVGEKRVHWTRCIHLAEDTIDSLVYGQPRMQNVKDPLLAIAMLLGGDPHMFLRGGFPGISFEADADTEITPDDEVRMKQSIDAYVHSMSRYLSLQGVTANSLDVQVASPQPHLQAQFQFIAATKGIPVRLLVGSEQAQLASGQDRANFNDNIRTRQSMYLTPSVLLPFIERLQTIGILPPNQEPLEVTWVRHDVLSRKEEAEVTKLRSEALAKYAANPILMDIVPPELFLAKILGFTPEEIEEATQAVQSNSASDMIEEDEE